MVVAVILGIVILFATTFYVARPQLGLFYVQDNLRLYLTRLFTVFSKTMVFLRHFQVYYQFTQSYVDTISYLFNIQVHGDYIQTTIETEKYILFEQRFLKQQNSSGGSVYTHTFKTLFPLDSSLNINSFDCTELLSKSQYILNASVQSLQFSGSYNTSHLQCLDYTRQFREFASHIEITGPQKTKVSFTHIDLIKECLGLTNDCTIHIVTSNLDLVIIKPLDTDIPLDTNLSLDTDLPLTLTSLHSTSSISIKQIDTDLPTSSPTSSPTSIPTAKSTKLKKTKNFINVWWDK